MLHVCTCIFTGVEAAQYCIGRLLVGVGITLVSCMLQGNDFITMISCEGEKCLSLMRDSGYKTRAVHTDFKTFS